MFKHDLYAISACFNQLSIQNQSFWFICSSAYHDFGDFLSCYLMNRSEMIMIRKVKNIMKMTEWVKFKFQSTLLWIKPIMKLSISDHISLPSKMKQAKKLQNLMMVLMWNYWV